jgi:hypothetical protein
MKDYRIYAMVSLVFVGGLILEIIPPHIFAFIDTTIGRSIGFLCVSLVGSILGIPEAILVGTLIGLMIDHSHDISSSHMEVSSNIAGSGQPLKIHGTGKVIKDLTPSYKGQVAQRLGLVTLDSHKNVMEDSISYAVR